MTRPSNPANFECAKAEMHRFEMGPPGTGAKCLNCGLVLSTADADELRADKDRWDREMKRIGR